MTHVIPWRNGDGSQAESRGYIAPVSAPALRYTKESSRRFVLITLAIALVGPFASGLYYAATGEGDFVVGAAIWLVLLVMLWPMQFARRRKARRLRLHGDQLETDELWIELTTDSDIHLTTLHGGSTLAIRFGRVRIVLGEPWCASHFEPADLRAIAARLERSIHEQCQEIGKRLRLLADRPRRSSWPDRSR